VNSKQVDKKWKHLESIQKVHSLWEDGEDLKQKLCWLKRKKNDLYRWWKEEENPHRAS